MGILDVSSRATVVFKADTTDMRKGLKDLTGDEKALAEQQLKAAEARNKQFEDWKGGLEKTIVTLGAVGIAAKVLFDGWKDAVQDAQAANATMGISIDKLKDAAHGLKTENDLLAWAAKTANSAFKNSEADLVTAQQAMLALTRQGRDAAEVQDKVTAALTTLRVRGLQELGVYVDTSKVKFDANGEAVDDYSNKLLLHQKILDALAVKAKGVAESEDGAGEDMKRSAVKMQDALDDLRKALGQFVIAMKPLIDVLAEAAKGWALLIDAAGGLPAWAGDKLYDITHGKSIEDVRAESDFYKRLRQEYEKTSPIGLSLVAEAKDYDAKLYDELIALRKKQLELLAERQANTVASYTPQRLSAEQVKKEEEWARAHSGDAETREEYAKAQRALEAALKAKKELDDEIAMFGLGHVVGDLNGGTQISDPFKLARIQSAGTNGFAIGASAGGVDTDAISAAMEKLNRAQDIQNQDTLLAKTFGPISDFDLYKKAFDGLTGAVGSAYDAWASGSESAAKAFKQFIGQSIAAVGKQMAVEAVKEGAYALGHLAIGDFGGAAAHATAAAEFAAGAVLAGVVAQELGTGGGSTSKGGAGASGGHASPSGGGGGGSSQPQQQQAIIIIGETFANKTGRMRQLEAADLVRRAGVGSTALEDS